MAESSIERISAGAATVFRLNKRWFQICQTSTRWISLVVEWSHVSLTLLTRYIYSINSLDAPLAISHLLAR